MQDLLIPDGNELELAKQASKLNHSSIIFLKAFKSVKEVNQYAVALKTQKIPLKYEIGALIIPQKPGNLQLAQKLKPHVKLVVAISDASEKINRAIFETPAIDVVFNLSSATGRDHTHYRRGGVNQVLGKLARDNGIAYGISFSRFLEEKHWRRILLLGRWIFNAMIFRKYNVLTAVFSMASKSEDIRSPAILNAATNVIAKI